MSKVTRVQVRRRRRINWDDDKTVQCVVLVSMGFSPSAVGRKLGLSMGQVVYRCGKCQVKCTDYRFMRSGTNAGKVAEIALDRVNVSTLVRGYLPG